MNSFANNLTSSQAWYRDYFQGMWNQAQYRATGLQAAYGAIKFDRDAINTPEAKNVARNLAQTESRMNFLDSNLRSGLDRRKAQKSTELSNADCLGYTPFQKERLKNDLASIEDAYVGLAAASLSWVRPSLQNYPANGYEFNVNQRYRSRIVFSSVN